MNITSKNNEVFEFRLLKTGDGKVLGEFFENLSAETRSKFGPHPLTREFAENTLCKNIPESKVLRFVVSSEQKMVGYFIVDFNEFEHEKSRYNSYQINLDHSLDPVFAPCIADDYQSLGIASQAMRALIDKLKELNVRSLVLLGGTQEPNYLARHFYKKFGFKEQGEFYTAYNGLNNIDMRLVL